MSNSQQKFAYLDTETTGLQPGDNAGELIEIAIITDVEGCLEYWSSKIKPQHIETAHPRALECNGYTMENWKDAPTFDVLVPEITRRLHKSVIVGHNVNFDLKFIKHHLDQSPVKEKYPFSHRHIIDTCTLAHEHLKPTGLKSVSMDNIRRWLGWSMDGAHTALKDAEDARKLHRKLSRAGWLQRLWWRYRGPKNMARALK